MELFITIIVTFFAGMGAGLGTGFAGMSAQPLLRYADDSLESTRTLRRYLRLLLMSCQRVSAYTYGKNKNLDIKTAS